MADEGLVTVEPQGLSDFVETLNEKLRAVGADNAERAFGLGCMLGLLPSVLVIAILLVFKVLSLILAIVLALMAVLVLIGVAMLLASRARRVAMDRVYKDEVEPEIELYIEQNDLSRLEFDTQAAGRIPADAPLQTYLAPEIFEPNELEEI